VSSQSVGPIKLNLAIPSMAEIMAAVERKKQEQIEKLLNPPVAPVSVPPVMLNHAHCHPDEDSLQDMGDLMDEYEDELIARWEAEGGFQHIPIHHDSTDWKEVVTPPIQNLPVARIKLSDEQSSATSAMINGDSFCLIGKAGTGKTTTVKEGIWMMESGHIIAPMHDTEGHKYLIPGSLGIVCVAFTNRAINNISKSFDLGTTRINFMTIHKLLEYIREDYSYEDPETSELRSSSRFVPSRTELRKLPRGLKRIYIEESSMVSIELHQKLKAACHSGTQFVYLGDLQQLPPPYGEGILGYKLNELPCIELTKIYRQAAENPIIALAWAISRGEKLGKEELQARYGHYKGLNDPIRITFFDKKIAADMAAIVMGKFFCQLIDRKVFDPIADIILVPFNGGKKNKKGEGQLGSDELNRAIAQHISMRDGKETHEIIAGFQKHYYAVGDKVLYNKKEGIITAINKNGKYIGKAPLPPSVDLHRDGTYHAKTSAGASISPEQMSAEDVDKFLLAIMDNPDDDVSNQASHIVHVKLIDEQMEDGSHETEIATRGEYANLLLAYAITIHKAQGSEWRKVFLLLHNSHFTVNREMLYTSVTRASQQLFIMCEPDSFSKGVSRQRIPGVSIQEKILWFKNKIDELRRKIAAATAAKKTLKILDEEEEEGE